MIPGQATAHIKITLMSSLFWTYGQMACWLLPYSLNLLWPEDTKHIFKNSNLCNPSDFFKLLGIEQLLALQRWWWCYALCLYKFLYFPSSLQFFFCCFHLNVTRCPSKTIWAFALCTFCGRGLSQVFSFLLSVLLATAVVWWSQILPTHESQSGTSIHNIAFTSQCWLEIGHGMSIYTMVIGKCYESGLFIFCCCCFSGEAVPKHLLAHC